MSDVNAPATNVLQIGQLDIFIVCKQPNEMSRKRYKQTADVMKFTVFSLHENKLAEVSRAQKYERACIGQRYQ